MDKLSAAEQREILSEVPNTIRVLARERDFYRDSFLKNASRQRVEKIAGEMIEKGIRPGTVQEVADQLEKEASTGALDLTVTEKAVAMVGPDMGKQASVSDEHYAPGGSDLERYLLQGS